MLKCMRTTINLDDDLLAEAKRRALNKKTTLRAVIEEALRAALLQPESPGGRPFQLVTFGGAGPRPGVNLDRTSELLEADDVERLGSD